jgi:ubiquinone/menaquinone biosynthesis C-methylase UbiE
MIRMTPGETRSSPWRLVVLFCLAHCSTVAAQPTAFYEFTQPDYIYAKPSRDGIGKCYLGREISHVMGHQGASWLERDNRDREERTDLLVSELGLRDADVVADIGAGTGYFVFRISPLVSQGKVLAVDIQQEMLDIVAERADGAANNVVPVLGTVTDINVPAQSVDLILLVDAYHEFSHPREMGESMFRALKPGGRIALVEYRAEDPSVPIKPLHKMSEAQAIREMSALGLRWLETRDSLPQQHLMFFAKPASDASVRDS